MKYVIEQPSFSKHILRNSFVSQAEMSSTCHMSQLPGTKNIFWLQSQYLFGASAKDVLVPTTKSFAFCITLTLFMSQPP